MFTLTSGAFVNGGIIPNVFTCEGDNFSPPLQWSGEPEGTQSFALIMDDPDAPGGTWNHWLLWDIPANVHALAQHYRPGRIMKNGTNDFGKTGYGGPCPPKSHGQHRYFFRMYALDAPVLDAPKAASRRELENDLERHRLGVAEHMGRFERK